MTPPEHEEKSNGWICASHILAGLALGITLGVCHLFFIAISMKSAATRTTWLLAYAALFWPILFTGLGIFKGVYRPIWWLSNFGCIFVLVVWAILAATICPFIILVMGWIA